MNPTLDPAAGLAVRLALAVLFASAALHKVRDWSEYRSAVAGYRLLPAALVVPVAFALAAAECVLAAGLTMPGTAGRVAAAGAAGLLTVYAAAVGANLARGRRAIDCGCGGPAGRQPLHGGLVARNAVAAAAALAAALPADGRALVWLDALTVAGAAAGFGLLWASLDFALANRARLAESGWLRERRSAAQVTGRPTEAADPVGAR